MRFVIMFLLVLLMLFIVSLLQKVVKAVFLSEKTPKETLSIANYLWPLAIISSVTLQITRFYLGDFSFKESKSILNKLWAKWQNTIKNRGPTCILQH